MPDEEIDANFKLLLQSKRNGQFFSPEIVAHFEYFMNTLNMNHKNHTENPFDCPQKYPALQYKSMALVPSQSNSDAIMESVRQEDLEDIDVIMANDTQGLIDRSLIIADFKSENKNDSEAKDCNINMTPKAVDKLSAMKGINLMKDRRLSVSVHNEIRNQSLMYVQGLTLFEKNRLLIKPNTHLKKVRDHVRNDKKSILSSS